MSIRRGQVFYADLGFKEPGSPETSVTIGSRPVIVVQNNDGNFFSRTTLVVPVAGNLKRVESPLPTHVVIGEKYGFLKPCVAQCEQLRCIDQKLLRTRLTMLPKTVMEQIDKALGIALGLTLYDPNTLYGVQPDYDGSDGAEG